jgi:Peptidase C26
MSCSDQSVSEPTPPLESLNLWKLLNDVGKEPNAPYCSTSARLSPLKSANTSFPRSEVSSALSRCQAIDRLGLDLRSVAWAKDGVIEAVEDDRGGFVLGVQWHAEP